jgi:hypothetical protein
MHWMVKPMQYKVGAIKTMLYVCKKPEKKHVLSGVSTEATPTYAYTIPLENTEAPSIPCTSNEVREPKRFLGERREGGI